MSRRRNKYYDRKLKLQAVQDYLGGGGSLRTICKKHGIKDKKQLRNWIKWYNGHSNAKAFILGTFHGLPKQNLDLYLSEFYFRFYRRNMNLFERLAVAVGSSFPPD